MVAQPALIGWEAKYRQIDLTIERAFKGEELVRRMKGWVTVDVARAIKIIREFGRLKVLDDRELVIEVEDMEKLHGLQKALYDALLHGLQKALYDAFENEVDVELVQKNSY
jgi:hypothetical protein